MSHTLSSQTPAYPGDAETVITRVKTYEKDGYTISTAFFSPHTGTHMDMPSHMTGDKSMVPDFTAGLFVVKGVLLDARDFGIIDYNPLWDDKIHEGCAVLLYTGWADNYGKAHYFSAHPVVSERFAGFLAGRKIRILGIDAPSPDHFPHTVHKKLMNGGVFILENLTNLDRLLDAGDFTLIAPPVKMDAEAAPVRAVAILGPRAEGAEPR